MLATVRIALAIVACLTACSECDGIKVSAGHFNRDAYVEDSIIKSLNNCPLCASKEPCLQTCRQAQRRSWSECLNRCLGDNPLLLETFTSIVKSSDGRLRGFGG